jgi:hypothetical protein
VVKSNIPKVSAEYSVEEEADVTAMLEEWGLPSLRHWFEGTTHVLSAVYMDPLKKHSHFFSHTKQSYPQHGRPPCTRRFTTQVQ